MKFENFVHTKYTEEQGINKCELRVFKFVVFTARLDNNFGNHLWIESRVGPAELSVGFRWWDESPEALKRYKNNMNIVEIEQRISSDDAS